MADNSKYRRNTWGTAFSDIRLILLNAVKSVRFVTTFIVFMVVGGSGVWLPWLLSNDNSMRLFNSESLFTFSLTVLGMLLMEWALAKEKTNDKVLIGVCVGIIAFALCLSGILSNKDQSDLMTQGGSVLALLLFVFANANHDKFDSDEAEASSTGYRDPDVNKLREGKE